jgi:hypothetical protein
MQCKLTRHDGHPTEDLEDAGPKVKDKLKTRLEDLTLKNQRLEQLNVVLSERRATLQQSWREAEKSLQE